MIWYFSGGTYKGILKFWDYYVYELCVSKNEVIIATFLLSGIKLLSNALSGNICFLRNNNWLRTSNCSTRYEMYFVIKSITLAWTLRTMGLNFMTRNKMKFSKLVLSLPNTNIHLNHINNFEDETFGPTDITIFPLLLQVSYFAQET